MTMTLVLSLILLVGLAHLLGALAERLGQPPLVGHMLAGIVLGPALLGWVLPSTSIGNLADLSVLFVVITAGMEMRLQEVLTVFRGRGVLNLLPSFLLPVTGGFLLAISSGLTTTPALVVGLCVSVTALPVALRILGSFGLLATPIARIAIAGALLSDVIVLLVLGVLAPSAQPGAGGNTLLLAGLGAVKLAALIGLVTGGSLLCGGLLSGMQRVHGQHWKGFSLLTGVSFMLLLAWASARLGFHFAIGAFLAALIVREQGGDGVPFLGLRRGCERATGLLFGPLFLSYQGVYFTVGTFAQPGFALSLILLAIVSKLVGGFVAARLSRLPVHDAYGVAIIMNARGAMEMVIASIAYRSGLVDQSLFATLLMVGIVTTVLTPLMLRAWMKRGDPAIDHNRAT